MTRSYSPSRRRFLTALGAGAAALPLVTLPGFVQAAGATPKGRTVVLIELAGGNDGLNTVVPITDPAYRGLRPDIGISAREGLGLNRDTALHPALRDLARLWERGEMQIVEGVGYPNPNRSHFRSIEIWNAGQGADGTGTNGWIANAFATRAPQPADAHGLVLGGSMGPLNGPGRFSSLRDEDSFVESLANLQQGAHAVRPQGSTPLDQVLGSYESAGLTGNTIAAKLERNDSTDWDFPDSELGAQLNMAARLLDAGVEVPVMKVVQDGYDTHDAQPYMHQALLEDLSGAIGAFSNALRRMGRWDEVTLVTYSEFGRTARENASGGTDHGTAAPVFVMGGSVAGGLSGARPSLDRLYEDDLVHTTDYRSVYSAILADHWGLRAAEFDLPNAPGLSLLRG